MTFGAAIKSGFKNLTNFKGRARRSEFWWFYLFLTLISFPLIFLAYIPLFAVLGTLSPDADGNTFVIGRLEAGGAFVTTFAIAGVMGLILFFLLLSVWVRRLHDGGYSGHLMWLSLIGLSIIPLIMAILDGQRYDNKYGPDPKAVGNAAWPVAQNAYGGPTPTPATYIPPAAPVAPQATEPLPPADPASDPFSAPPR